VKSFADGKIDVYLGPVELGAPDDLEQVVIDLIDGAKSSLDIAVQEIDSLEIAEAIINARCQDRRSGRGDGAAGSPADREPADRLHAPTALDEHVKAASG
jgi:hypothetical protein